jgi:hypothetical protein
VLQSAPPHATSAPPLSTRSSRPIRACTQVRAGAQARQSRNTAGRAHPALVANSAAPLEAPGLPDRVARVFANESIRDDPQLVNVRSVSFGDVLAQDGVKPAGNATSVSPS